MRLSVSGLHRKFQFLLMIFSILLFSTYAWSQGFQGGGDRRPPQSGMKPPQRLEPDNIDIDKFSVKEFKGYLVDCNWGKTGKDDMGRDIIRKPSLITRKHLQSKESMDAGYGIFIQTPGRDNVFFKFDTSGNLNTEDFVTQRCNKKNKIYVLVKGYMDTQSHTISVVDIEESSKSARGFNDEQRRPDGMGDRPPDMGNF